MEPKDLPDINSVDKQYVHLVAKSDDAHFQFQREAKILLSCRDGMVFIQMDKPVYTPRQSGKNSTPYQDPFKVFSCLEQLVGPMGVHCNLKYTYGHLLSRENTQFPNQRKNKGIVQYQCLIIIFIILYHFRFKQDKNALKVE